MRELKKFIFPVLFALLGIVLILFANVTGQNGFFIFGAFAVLLAGLISLVAALVELNKILKLVLSVLMVILVVILAFANYNSIIVPIEFKAEKERRYAHVIQRLKDIRTAELAYKAVYQKYTGSTDSLVAFVKYDSIPFVKAMGEVPDTMSLENALKAGIVSRDTNYINVGDSLFGGKDEDRVHPFNADSMVVVPYTNGKVFALQAGMIERSGVKVPVFQATDSKPFDPSDPLQVGSMTDPKTNGNWE